jgi:hypothetical protein
MTDAAVFDDLRTRLDEALRLAGGPAAVARDLGISRGAPHHWRRTGRCPAERTRDIARLSGLPAQYLRPDLFGPVP